MVLTTHPRIFVARQSRQIQWCRVCKCISMLSVTMTLSQGEGWRQQVLETEEESGCLTPGSLKHSWEKLNQVRQILLGKIGQFKISWFKEFTMVWPISLCKISQPDKQLKGVDKFHALQWFDTLPTFVGHNYEMSAMWKKLNVKIIYRDLCQHGSLTLPSHFFFLWSHLSYENGNENLLILEMYNITTISPQTCLKHCSVVILKNFSQVLRDKPASHYQIDLVLYPCHELADTKIQCKQHPYAATLHIK